MPRRVYRSRNFGPDRLLVIDQANAILDEYAKQGFELTLRQLYYQFVARALIPNNQREYNKLGSTINDARLAGRIDWDYIVDRTRNLEAPPSWSSPESIVKAASASYQRDLWQTQPRRVEVWVEKDALVGVIEHACEPLRVPFFSCRGYTSQSEMWTASQRFMAHATDSEQGVLVLHLGDHDPSGIDMSRDIEERIRTFMFTDRARAWMAYRETDDTDSIDWDDIQQWMNRAFELRRIALNWDQVEQYAPPPNPAKLTDSRARGYIHEFGGESWELDALEPAVLTELIRDEVNAVIDRDAWDDAAGQEDEERAQLGHVHEQWAEIIDGLGWES